MRIVSRPPCSIHCCNYEGNECLGYFITLMMSKSEKIDHVGSPLLLCEANLHVCIVGQVLIMRI